MGELSERQERNLINEFKNDYRAAYLKQEHIDMMREPVVDLNTKLLGYKSPGRPKNDQGKLSAMSINTDRKYLDLLDRRDRILRAINPEVEHLQSDIERVERITGRMEPWAQDVMYHVSGVGDRTMADYENVLHLSLIQVKRNLDAEILRVMKDDTRITEN